MKETLLAGAALILLFLALDSVHPVLAFDPDSFCKGFCQARYQDGMFKEGRCACIDYYALHQDSFMDFTVRRAKTPHGVDSSSP